MVPLPAIGPNLLARRRELRANVADCSRRQETPLHSLVEDDAPRRGNRDRALSESPCQE